MMKLPTPQAGCYAATYPNPSWQQKQCGPASTQHETVGDGYDWTATSATEIGQASTACIQSLCATIGGVLAAFTSVKGVTSETDQCVAPFLQGCIGKDPGNGQEGWYSLQINSNTFCTSATSGCNSLVPYPVEYDGNPTTGWEQFIYSSHTGGNCGISTGCGGLWIEYWLLGFAKTYGSCPRDVPPDGGNGWLTFGANCAFNTGTDLTPTVPPADLSSLSMWAYANSVYSGPADQVGMCFQTIGNIEGACYAMSRPDTVLNLYQNWYRSEFNIIGYTDGSRANFNSGATIYVVNILENHLGFTGGIIPVGLGTGSCQNHGLTGETNNLNLGSCGPATVAEANALLAAVAEANPQNPSFVVAVTGISFTESN